MLSKVITATLHGIEARPVLVETDITRGLPALNIVGLADTTVKEARERIRSAIINTGCRYPMGRITVNLSPAYVKKKGSHFDLAMAIGIIASSEQIFDRDIEEYCFIGELSLDGRINKVNGILPMLMTIKAMGIKKVIVPKANAEEASLVDDLNIYEGETLQQVLDHFNLVESLKMIDAAEGIQSIRQASTSLDFAQVKGQEMGKRAITVAVAGNHGILMTGSPGTGKTMMAMRIPTIMQPMTYEEIVEATMVYSVAGLLTEKDPYITQRPFRQPHHRITPPGLIGGGNSPRPGEVSLAHKGVLFLDEMGEFDRNTIEMLRVPLETGKINVFRQGENFTFPADFMLVAATNPCRCGYYGDPSHECSCKPGGIDAYRAKLSGPILDRIDMHIETLPVSYNQLGQEEGMSSAAMGAKIRAAQERQEARYIDESIMFNSQMDNGLVEKFCSLGPAENKMLRGAFGKLNLNPRTLMKVVKVARTIADIEGEERIREEHLAEALHYRAVVDGVKGRRD